MNGVFDIVLMFFRLEYIILMVVGYTKFHIEITEKSMKERAV
jgi:hypothetical protein